MKVLMLSPANRSHLHIAAPVAWALRNAGHEVLVAGRPDLAESIGATGLTGVALGEPDEVGMTERMNEGAGRDDPAAAAARRSRREGNPRQEDYAADDPAAELGTNVANLYPVICPDSLFEELIAFARHWRPDLIIWDMLAYAGPVAARACGAAHARLLLATDGVGLLRQRMAERAEPRDPLRAWLEPKLAEFGAPWGEDVAVGQRSLDLMPPWTFHPRGVAYIPMRHVAFNGPAMLPDWLKRPAERPRVCVTLGNSHRDAGRVEASVGALLGAVADLDVEVVATLNAEQLRSLPKVPDNTRVAGFVPLNALLPTCDAIVHHGGAGTFWAALEHGVPQLLTPSTWWGEKWYGPVAMGNAVQEQGAGLYIADSDRLTAELLREGLERVLGDPSFGAQARRLRDETRQMPAPAAVVPRLEALAAEARGG
jgi:glycosyltransferase (activator-dependent family)